jgi:hypothetical protein
MSAAVGLELYISELQTGHPAHCQQSGAAPMCFIIHQLLTHNSSQRQPLINDANGNW